MTKPFLVTISLLAALSAVGQPVKAQEPATVLLTQAQGRADIDRLPQSPFVELDLALYGNHRPPSASPLDYQGPVMASAVLYLPNSLTLGKCEVPYGVYLLQSASPAQFENHEIAQLDLVGNGAVQLRVLLTAAKITDGQILLGDLRLINRDSTGCDDVSSAPVLKLENPQQ